MSSRNVLGISHTCSDTRSMCFLSIMTASAGTLHIENHLGFQTSGGFPYLQIVKRHRFDVRLAWVALPSFDKRTQVMIVELSNVEALADKLMRLFQVEDFIQPVHQQGFPVHSPDFNLLYHRWL